MSIDLDSPDVHVFRDAEGNITHVEQIREPVDFDRDLSGSSVPLTTMLPPPVDWRDVVRRFLSDAQASRLYDLSAFITRVEPDGSYSFSLELNNALYEAPVLGDPQALLNNREAPQQLRLFKEKSLNGQLVAPLAHMVHGIPVWQSGLTVVMGQEAEGGDYRVTSSQSTLHRHDPEQVLSDLRDAGWRIRASSATDSEKAETSTRDDPAGGALDLLLPEHFLDHGGPGRLARLLRVDAAAVERIVRAQNMVYLYSRDARLDPDPVLPRSTFLNGGPPILKTLEDVRPAVRERQHRLTVEVVFEMNCSEQFIPSCDTINWRVFLDSLTHDVLYARAFVASCFADLFPGLPVFDVPEGIGTIYPVDPLTTAGAGSDPFQRHGLGARLAALNSSRFRQSRNLNLDIPRGQPAAAKDEKGLCQKPPVDESAGRKSLHGRFVRIAGGLDSPFDPDPSEAGDQPVPIFDYTMSLQHEAGHGGVSEQAKADTAVNFTAVNAYYHTDSMFRMLEQLGYDPPEKRYFHGKTEWPIRVDPRGTHGAVNAMVYGDNVGDGVKKFDFGAMQPRQDGPLGQQVGNALDARVAMHEFSHALLFASTHAPLFEFAHSGGDALAAILCDPCTALTGEDRFSTFPWLASAMSNHNYTKDHWRYHGGSVGRRDDMQLWGWGGRRDRCDNRYGYKREQILSATLFDVYRALGGDSAAAKDRRIAARYAVYLIVQAIFLCPHHNVTPMETPEMFVTKLEEADIGRPVFWDWDAKRYLPGGRVMKVIRWAFEKHGAFKEPRRTAPVPGQGLPGPVDVYIDDHGGSGKPRGGEYWYTDDPATSEIWNRTSEDGVRTGPGDYQEPDHTNPEANRLFVRVKNRGYAAARDIAVRLYRRQLGGAVAADLEWPDTDEWQPVGILRSPREPLAPGGSVVLGPCAWVAEPGTVVLGVASAQGDASNLDPVKGSVRRPFESCPVALKWLVPYDNNLGYRVF